MFKFGSTPSVSADPVEHADYLEIECLRQSDKNSSGGDLAAVLSKVSDDLTEEKPDDDVKMEGIVDATFRELGRRAEHATGGVHCYPFDVDEDTKLLKLKTGIEEAGLYLFLLLATRLNMKTQRSQAGIDGTLLFEEISCEVAKAYWGQRTSGVVFGTSRRKDGSEVGAFPAAVDDLCKKLGECDSFSANSGYTPTAQDGKLDIVVWKPFADSRQGKLIGFGQCKTGTNWEEGRFELRPEGFCKKWVKTMPTVTPVRLLFMAARPPASDWFDACVDAGILFDRIRIIDFSPEMPDLRTKWLKWTREALSKNGITLS